MLEAGQVFLSKPERVEIVSVTNDQVAFKKVGEHFSNVLRFMSMTAFTDKYEAEYTKGEQGAY